MSSPESPNKKLRKEEESDEEIPTQIFSEIPTQLFTQSPDVSEYTLGDITSDNKKEDSLYEMISNHGQESPKILTQLSNQDNDSKEEEAKMVSVEKQKKSNSSRCYSSSSSSSSDSSFSIGAIARKEHYTKKNLILPNNCNMNFTKICPHCNLMVCDGTTFSAFIHKWIDIEADNYFDARCSFMDHYIMLKEFELFQRTRYTNPDVEFARSGDVPKCVYAAFEEFFETGDTKFNKSRAVQRIKHNTQKREGLGFDDLTTKNA